MTKINEWLQEEKLILLQGWSRDGLSIEQISKNMGIDDATLYRWMNKNCDICEAIKKGKEVVDYEVENALYKNAMSGNVTAQIFWLKNRQKDKWREKQEVTVTDNPIEDLTPLAELLKGDKK